MPPKQASYQHIRSFNLAEAYRKWYCSAKGEMKITYQDQLREIANEQYGFVTTKDAADAGIPAVELRKLATRGSLKNVRRGVYRFTDARRTEKDAFAEAVLRVGDDAFLIGESVLALLDLGLVEPKTIKVGTPNRVRQRDTGFVKIVEKKLPPETLTTYSEIRSQPVADALIESKSSIMPDRLMDAFKKANRLGLLTPKEASRVRIELRSHNRTKRVA